MPTTIANNTRYTSVRRPLLQHNNDDSEDEGFIMTTMDIYRLAIRTNSEILEDLAAIIRILRQINALYQLEEDSLVMSEEPIYQDKAGLEDLQAVLTMDSSHEDTGRRKRQSTLALLSLITYQYEHCSDQYLSRYLDPDGVYDPTLAIFAAAIYEEDEEGYEPKSCRDIMIAAEELYGPGWLKEFHKGKEGALRKMLEKLTFIAKIRLKIRDTDRPIAR
ncbi:hypothetical protein CU098_005478 [Rhizopus stolonifer]|uniref:Uncharacterized protein n=1 Tax=Rhizopus stolonifer TaxID=4846 RepID=A0A367KQV3_RHIST|nr:hypothetical protein CU098_005478 [Rhizopus stolonifer]